MNCILLAYGVTRVREKGSRWVTDRNSSVGGQWLDSYLIGKGKGGNEKIRFTSRNELFYVRKLGHRLTGVLTKIFHNKLEVNAGKK
jgi:hypothetical protein